MVILGAVLIQPVLHHSFGECDSLHSDSMVSSFLSEDQDFGVYRFCILLAKNTFVSLFLL
jgi:hypothetical protein